MTTTIETRGVDFVLVTVEDLDRARSFYADVLGMEPLSVWGGTERPVMGAEFENGTVTIALFDVAKTGGTHRPGSGAIAIHVDDVQAARERLEAHGVTFVMDTIDSGVCHQAIFHDSEGNTLILHNRYAPRD